MKNFTKGFLSCVLSAVIFGLLPFFTITISDAGIPMFMLTCFHGLFTLPLLYFLGKRQMKGRPKVAKKDVLILGFLGLFGMLLTQVLLMTSYRFLPSGTATSIHYVYPLIVLLICAVFFKDKITAKNILCFAMCMAGIVLLYNPEGGFTVKGALIAFVSGIVWATYSVLLEKTQIGERVPQFQMAFIMNLFAVSASLILSLVFGQFTLRFTAKAYILSILFSWIQGVLASVLYRYGISMINSRKASIVSTLEPVTSILVGIIIFKEAATVKGLLGCAMILASSVLLVIFSKDEEPAEAAG